MLLIELKPVKQIRKPYGGYVPPKTTTKGVSANAELKPTKPSKILLEHAEYTRRNKLIHDLYDDCKYKFPKTLVRPVDDDAYEKEGLYQIEKVFECWLQYCGKDVTDENKVEWPKSDNPLIVQARCLKNNLTIKCTTNYMCLPVDKAGK